MSQNPGFPPPPPPGAYGAGPYGHQAYSPAPEGPIGNDLPCRKCGYNLRGLTPAMRCPECGTAVGYSLQGDLLRFCDPGWVDTLSRGTSLIVWGIVTYIAALILGMILGAAAGGSRGGAVGVVILVGIAVIGAWILMTIGWWLLTQPDPSGMGEERYGTSRKISRVALIVGIFSQLLNLVTQAAPLDASMMIGVLILQMIAGLISVVGFYAQLIYLEKLARRIPDDKLSGRAYTVRWGITISYGVLIVVGVVVAIAVRNTDLRQGPGGGIAALGCIAIIALIAVAVFLIMYLFLLIAFHGRMKESAQAARSGWAAAPWSPSGARPA